MTCCSGKALSLVFFHPGSCFLRFYYLHVASAEEAANQMGRIPGNDFSVEPAMYNKQLLGPDIHGASDARRLEKLRDKAPPTHLRCSRTASAFVTLVEGGQMHGRERYVQGPRQLSVQHREVGRAGVHGGFNKHTVLRNALQMRKKGKGAGRGRDTQWFVSSKILA